MKKWTAPELIIIGRSKPEEAVLWTCKKAKTIVGGTGAEAQNDGCYLIIPTDPCGESCEYKTGS